MRTIEFDYISDIHLDSWVDPRSDRQPSSVRKFASSRLLKECSSNRPGTVVLAGDISHSNEQIALFVMVLLDNYYKNVVLVPGNHDMASVPGAGSFKDYKARVRDIRDRLAGIPGAHLLQGDTAAFDGIRYGGISGWSDYSYAIDKLGSNHVMGDLQYLRSWDALNVRLPGGGPHVSPLTLFNEQKGAISRLAAESDVMVTHYGPVAAHIPDMYADLTLSGFFYFDGTEMLHRRSAPTVWVYGHTHAGAKFSYNRTDMLCNPLGRNGEDTAMTGILTYRKTI